MQIIDLFSGIGGFSLSGRWMGWRTIQFCENNNFCKQILKKHWPEIPIHDDIKTLTVKQIISNKLYDSKEKTIFTAGVPCQPWSNAGKRQGETDIRNLWPETIRFTELFRPDFTLFENVPGLLNWNKGLFFENICTSLENAGYEIWPFIIPSASIGSWDKRDRVWIIAYNNRLRCNNEQKGQIKTLQNEIRITEAKKQGRRKQQCRIIESDWLRNWIEVASELCRSNARIPNRMDRIKALGNSINPHVAFEIFKAIEQYDNNSGIANHGRGL